MFGHKKKGTRKEYLAQWMSLRFKMALTSSNICKGFLATPIYPLNLDAMVSKIQPFQQFMDIELEIHLVDLQVEELLNENLNLLEKIIYHYYVDIDRLCEDHDFQLNGRGSLNDTLYLSMDIGSKSTNFGSTNVGFKNVNLGTIHTYSSNL